MAVEGEEIEDLPLDTDVEGDVPVDAGRREPAEAQSSGAKGETKEVDTLSLVRDVVDGKAAAKAASPAEGNDAGEKTGDGATQKEQDDVDYTDVPFHMHPRFQRLLREKKAADADAARYRNVDSFCRTHSVSAEEAAEALVVAASAKADPVGTLERLKPWITDLMVRAGALLPPDLNQGVEKGVYTPEAAREVSRLRAQQQSFETREQMAADQRKQDQAVQFQRSMIDAANAWEADRRQKDPGFEAKAAPLMREVAFLHATEGKPDTPQGVTEQLARAYKAVNARLVVPASTAARKPAIRPVTGGQVNGTARPAPRSTMDIINARVG